MIIHIPRLLLPRVGCQKIREEEAQLGSPLFLRRNTQGSVKKTPMLHHHDGHDGQDLPRAAVCSGRCSKQHHNAQILGPNHPVVMDDQVSIETLTGQTGVPLFFIPSLKISYGYRQLT